MGSLLAPMICPELGSSSSRPLTLSLAEGDKAVYDWARKVRLSVNEGSLIYLCTDKSIIIIHVVT